MVKKLERSPVHRFACIVMMREATGKQQYTTNLHA